MVDLINIFQTQYPNNRKYFFFVYLHETLTITDNLLGHRENLNKFKISRNHIDHTDLLSNPSNSYSLLFYNHIIHLFLLVNILLLKYLIKYLEKKNGNVYEEIASGFCSGKSWIQLLHIFPLGNENDAFLLLLKTNRTIYKSFIFS